ncbi:hypothetical protein DdX_19038 [Ditylenchus destructor]|uniref:Uncharacterized protein n=1 Tax=Ditylenchus destructor TaxID=166010 RepID=A0AAD4MND7_9BILA|nr:hypothetical protein DdX_19038 [Ditylenchus destructor]
MNKTHQIEIVVGPHLDLKHIWLTDCAIRHQIPIKTSSSTMSATPNKGFQNPKLLPSDPIVVGGKYTGKVTSLDEGKNHFEFIVQLKSR